MKIQALTTGRGVSGIGAGADGQELIIINVGAQGVNMIGNLSPGSGTTGMTLGGESGAFSFSMGASDTLHLIYDTNSNRWLEISRSNNVPVIN